MRVLTPGHQYELDHLDGSNKTVLQFVSRQPLHEPVEGVINQEVLRAIIDRVKVLNAELPWNGNKEILHHLRMALVLHEARAMVRHVEKGQLLPEALPVGHDGHFAFVEDCHLTEGAIARLAKRAGIGMTDAVLVDEWPIKIDEDVEILVAHSNLAFARGPEEIRDWLAWCPARWIDHNGGGWTWHGMSGQARFVRLPSQSEGR